MIWLCPVLNASSASRFHLLHSPELLFCIFSSGRGCPMLIPLRHKNMEGRRWPIVTFALIALNLLIFLGTHWKIEEQEHERLEVRMHVIELAATHPELRMPENVEKFVNGVRSKTPHAALQQLTSTRRIPQHPWDAKM